MLRFARMRGVKDPAAQREDNSSGFRAMFYGKREVGQVVTQKQKKKKNRLQIRDLHLATQSFLPLWEKQRNEEEGISKSMADTFKL